MPSIYTSNLTQSLAGIPARFSNPSTPDLHLTPVPSPLQLSVPTSTPAQSPPRISISPTHSLPIPLVGKDTHGGQAEKEGSLVALTRRASMDEYIAVTQGQRRASVERGTVAGLGMPFGEREGGQERRGSGGREERGTGFDDGIGGTQAGRMDRGDAKTRMIRDLIRALGEEKKRTAGLEMDLLGAHNEIDALKDKLQTKAKIGSSDIEKSQQATIKFLLADVESMRRKLNQAEEIESDVLAEFAAIMGSGRNASIDAGLRDNGAQLEAYKTGGIDRQPTPSTLPNVTAPTHPPPPAESAFVELPYTFPMIVTALPQALPTPSEENSKSRIEAHSDDPSPSPPLSRGYVGKELLEGHEGEIDEDGDVPTTRCHCLRVNFGEMIRCDGRCQTEWFHLPCVGLQAVPKGGWFCEDCRKNQGRLRADASVWLGGM